MTEENQAPQSQSQRKDGSRETVFSRQHNGNAERATQPVTIETKLPDSDSGKREHGSSQNDEEKDSSNEDGR